MTPDSQRIAIAEALGWKWYRLPKMPSDDRIYRCLFLPAIHEYEGQSEQWLVKADGTERLCNLEFMWKTGCVSDYPNDLNACHEMEKFLDPAPGRFSFWCEYWEQLETVTGARTFDKDIDTDCIAMLHATAGQRCEAFLKTIGKWTK